MLTAGEYPDTVLGLWAANPLDKTEDECKQLGLTFSWDQYTEEEKMEITRNGMGPVYSVDVQLVGRYKQMLKNHSVIPNGPTRSIGLEQYRFSVFCEQTNWRKVNALSLPTRWDLLNESFVRADDWNDPDWRDPAWLNRAPSDEEPDGDYFENTLDSPLIMLPGGIYEMLRTYFHGAQTLRLRPHVMAVIHVLYHWLWCEKCVGNGNEFPFAHNRF